MLQVRIAKTLILTLDVVIELSIEEFWESNNLPYLLASMLGLDPSQVKIVDVVRENNPGRGWSMFKWRVTRPELANAPALRVKVEFADRQGSSSGIPVRFLVLLDSFK